MRCCKKIVSGIMCVMLLLTTSAYAVDDVQKVETPHVYTVLPGSEEWNEMAVSERLDSCYVSLQEAKGMTTEALVETVVNYPYLVNMYAFDTLAEGIESVSSFFPGLAELLQRQDAVEALQKFTVNKQHEAKSNAGSTDDALKELHVATLESFLTQSEVKDDALVSPRVTVKTVKTPNGTNVEAYYGLTWRDQGVSEEYANEISNAYLEVYPSAKIVRDASPSYNCHSYAWHSTGSNNKYWINDPSAYMDDGSYSMSFSKAGNKIVYEQVKGHKIIHSGIVKSSNGGKTTVTSKWGTYALYSHERSDCPYSEEFGSISTSYWE
ncbi:MAG: hypothetical protein SOR83_07570 [Butyricicoccus pullicaecorum]|nr:hypothetical protein [Butyricicoccus pullicaecorum]